jgi:hypothetical protein
MRVALMIAVCGLALSACQERVEVPEAPDGTCFMVSPQEDGEIRFTALPDLQPSMEYCAAGLEERRVFFLRMGGTRREVIGYYGSQYLFVDSAGVSLSRNLNGGRFIALRRTHDGRLAIPGAFEQEPAAPEGESGQTPQG